jgi:hypothetical protein
VSALPWRSEWDRLDEYVAPEFVCGGCCWIMNVAVEISMQQGCRASDIYFGCIGIEV